MMSAELERLISQQEDHQADDFLRDFGIPGMNMTNMTNQRGAILHQLTIEPPIQHESIIARLYRIGDPTIHQQLAMRRDEGGPDTWYPNETPIRAHLRLWLESPLLDPYLFTVEGVYTSLEPILSHQTHDELTHLFMEVQNEVKTMLPQYGNQPIGYLLQYTRPFLLRMMICAICWIKLSPNRDQHVNRRALLLQYSAFPEDVIRELLNFYPTAVHEDGIEPPVKNTTTEDQEDWIQKVINEFVQKLQKKGMVTGGIRRVRGTRRRNHHRLRKSMRKRPHRKQKRTRRTHHR